jgi:hypothetical protein
MCESTVCGQYEATLLLKKKTSAVCSQYLLLGM